MAQLASRLQTYTALRPLGRYVTVGLAGTFVDVGLFTLLRVVLGVAALPANTLSYSAGIINNYILHRRWTFDDRPQRETAGQFVQFVLVSLSALVLNNFLVVLLAPAFALAVRGAAADVLAKLAATGVSMCWNYVANNYWTFAEAKD